MSLDDNQHFVDVAAYRKSMKDPGRWMKLLRGEVNIARAVRVAMKHAASTAASRMKSFAQLLGFGEEPRLSRDLKRLLRTRHVTMYFSEGEPGRDILMHDAKRTAMRAMKAGRLELEVVAGADHTFSHWVARREILQRLLDHFARRYAVVGKLEPREERAPALKAA
jgi:hypothetical protein